MLYLQQDIFFLIKLEQGSLEEYGTLGYRIANIDRSTFFNQVLYMASQILRASPQDQDMRHCYANMINVWCDHYADYWNLKRSTATRVLLKIFASQDLYDQSSEDAEPTSDTSRSQSWTQRVLAAVPLLGALYELGEIILECTSSYKNKKSKDLNRSLANSALGRCLQEVFRASSAPSTSTAYEELSFKIRASWKSFYGFRSSWDRQIMELDYSLSELQRIKQYRPDYNEEDACDEEEIYQYDELL